MTFYTDDFYERTASGSERSARVVLPLLFDLIRPRSVVDVGCGIGSWLRVARDLGVEDIVGIDGSYVDRTHLRIPEQSFVAADLGQPLSLNRKFDLAICLEVAEHLEPAGGEQLIRTLIAASDVVLFSAAAPLQGGVDHRNEQWPDYWARQFAAGGFLWIDCLRNLIWDDRRVEWWYAQNSIVYVRETALQAYPNLATFVDGSRESPLSLPHPIAYISYVGSLRQFYSLEALPGVRFMTRAFCVSVVRAVRKRIAGGRSKSTPGSVR